MSSTRLHVLDMFLLFAPVTFRLSLRLCLLLPCLRCCSGLTADDVWSGRILDRAQRARAKNALLSDRLMQHIWQHPDRASQFIDCDILADSETDKHFQFLNFYDADDEREKLLSSLPDDGYVRGLWPVKNGKSTVPYTFSKNFMTVELLSLAAMFLNATKRWERAASVDFNGRGSEKPRLEVVLDGGCFATLGYHATEPRRLSLHPGRCTEDVIVHLLGHVLGLPHPTSTVGRANELYLMPHHAAPRSMGVLRTRAGVAFDPFDIMAVDPWFCGVSNRTTWWFRDPGLYKWAALTGYWRHQRNLEIFSASTGLLQREIQLKAGAAGCANQCADPCQEFLTPKCNCVRPLKGADNSFESIAYAQGYYPFDMGMSLSWKYVPKKLMDAPSIRAFFHSTDVDERNMPDAAGVKCFQCTLFVFTIHTNGVFDSEENRLIALGSRCAVFSLELSAALEEAWYRLCMHDLLHTNNQGDVELAFRGPGSVLIRYFSCKDIFPAFHTEIKEKMNFTWRVESVAGCKCSNGPNAEIQHSVNKL